MREQVFEVLGRTYVFKYHFGLKFIRLVDADPYREDWFWCSRYNTYQDSPAFVRKAIQLRFKEAA
jgi:hypothetical protein